MSVAGSSSALSMAAWSLRDAVQRRAQWERRMEATAALAASVGAAAGGAEGGSAKKTKKEKKGEPFSKKHVRAVEALKSK
jgi:hypothetical protein